MSRSSSVSSQIPDQDIADIDNIGIEELEIYSRSKMIRLMLRFVLETQIETFIEWAKEHK